VVRLPRNWATKIVDRLNGHRLSDKYKAQPGRHFGARIEADVAALERNDRGSLFEGLSENGGGVATKGEVYPPPATILSAAVDFDDPDLFEVQVYRGSGGWELVAAVELVSEANKDREEHRRAFAVKCASYLQKGISLVVVDTVTTYSADLHDELCELMSGAEALRWASPSGLSVVVYRATRTTGESGPALNLDVYPFPAGIGQELPTVPLRLNHDFAVPLELELTYANACESLRIG
jgi:hypothetical protein